jgi:hypothetical protein
MTPDQIKNVIEKEYKELTFAELPSGLGWSFFLGAPQRGRKSNRILWVSQSSSSDKTKMKLSATAGLRTLSEFNSPGTSSWEFDFVDGVSSLKKHVESELKAYRAYLEDAAR